MLRLAALALVLGGLAAAFCLVPVAGRTALARFEAAPDAGTFLSSAWDEWRGPPAAAAKRARPPARRSEKTARRQERPVEPAAEEPLARADAAPRSRSAPPAAPASRPPAEDHREADRAALDRLLSERSR